MVAKNENMDYLLAKYGSSDVQSDPVVPAVKNEYLFDTYGIPEHKIREFILKQSLIDAAELLLSNSEHEILILSRDANRRPLLLEANGAGRLINGLEFDYEG